MHRILSLYDVMQFPEAYDTLTSGDEEKVKQFFYNIGFDINKPIECEYVYHRPMCTKDIYLTNRFIGEERQDGEWLDSEYCTRENRLEKVGRKDISLLKDLLTMSKLPNFTKMIIEHMQGDTTTPTIKFVMESEDAE